MGRWCDRSTLSPGSAPIQTFQDGQASPLERSPITADLDLVILVALCLVIDPDMRPTAESVGTSDYLAAPEDEEIALQLLDRVGQVRPELSNSEEISGLKKRFVLCIPVSIHI